MAREDVVGGTRYVESGADRDGDFSIITLSRKDRWSYPDNLTASQAFHRAFLWKSLHALKEFRVVEDGDVRTAVEEDDVHVGGGVGVISRCCAYFCHVDDCHDGCRKDCLFADRFGAGLDPDGYVLHGIQVFERLQLVYAMHQRGRQECILRPVRPCAARFEPLACRYGTEECSHRSGMA